MYIYFNSSLEPTTVIPHGEILRQGGDLNVYVCFDEEVQTAGKSISCSVIHNESVIGTPHFLDYIGNRVFYRTKDSEVIYDLVEGQSYQTYHTKFYPNEATEEFGNITLSFEFIDPKGKVTKTAAVKTYVEKTIGYSKPKIEITPSQYDQLIKEIQKIDAKNVDLDWIKDNVIFTTNIEKIELTNIDKGRILIDTGNGNIYKIVQEEDDFEPKVINFGIEGLKEYLNQEFQQKLVIDDMPTPKSENLVKSGGVFDAIDAVPVVEPKSYNKNLTGLKINEEEFDIPDTEIDFKKNDKNKLKTILVGNDVYELETLDELVTSTEPLPNDPNPIQGGAVYEALKEKSTIEIESENNYATAISVDGQEYEIPLIDVEFFTEAQNGIDLKAIKVNGVMYSIVGSGGGDGKAITIVDEIPEDAKETTFYKILPQDVKIAVPNTGYVDKFYFNTDLTVEEVTNIVKQITDWQPYDESGTNFIYPIYAINRGNAGFEVGAEDTAVAIIRNEDYSEISLVNFGWFQTLWTNYLDETEPSMTEIGWQYDSLNTVPGLTQGGEVSSSFETFKIGSQNELLKDLVYTIGKSKTSLGIIDGKQYRKINFEDDPVAIKVVDDVIKVTEENKIYKVGGGLTKKAVPNSGTVDKIYFDTNLSYNEVLLKLQQLKLTETENSTSYFICMDENSFSQLAVGLGSDGNGIESLMIIGILSVNGSPKSQYIWSEKEFGGMVQGWQPEFIEYIGENKFIELNINAASTKEGISIGTQNELIKELIYIQGEDEPNYSVIHDKQVKNIVFDDNPVAINVKEKLPDNPSEKVIYKIGSKSPVPNTGYVEKIYFDTSLSDAEVEKIIDEFCAVSIIDGQPGGFVFFSLDETSASSFAIMIGDMGGIKLIMGMDFINGDVTPIWSNQTYEEMGITTTGWAITDDYIEVNATALPDDSSIGGEFGGMQFGIYNDILVDLIFVGGTPKIGVYDKEFKEILFKGDEIPVLTEVDKLPLSPNKNAIYKLKNLMVPNTGYVDKVYFNKNLTTEEVLSTFKKIKFNVATDEFEGVVTTFYWYSVVGSVNANGMLDDIFVMTDNLDNPTIFDIVDNKNDTTLFDINDGWNPNIPNYIEINKEVVNFGTTNAFATGSVGHQNELLTDMFYIVKEPSYGVYDKKFKEILFKGDNIPALATVNKLSEATDEKTIYKVLNKQTVPNTGFVEKVYFDTSLSDEEVEAILSQLTYSKESDYGPMETILAYAKGSSIKMINIIATNGAYAIGDEDTNILWINEAGAEIFSQAFGMTITPGWQTFENPIEINSEVAEALDSSWNVGTQNELIKDLFYVTNGTQYGVYDKEFKELVFIKEEFTINNGETIETKDLIGFEQVLTLEEFNLIKECKTIKANIKPAGSVIGYDYYAERSWEVNNVIGHGIAFKYSSSDYSNIRSFNICVTKLITNGQTSCSLFVEPVEDVYEISLYSSADTSGTFDYSNDQKYTSDQLQNLSITKTFTTLNIVLRTNSIIDDGVNNFIKQGFTYYNNQLIVFTVTIPNRPENGYIPFKGTWSIEIIENPVGKSYVEEAIENSITKVLSEEV